MVVGDIRGLPCGLDCSMHHTYQTVVGRVQEIRVKSVFSSGSSTYHVLDFYIFQKCFFLMIPYRLFRFVGFILFFANCDSRSLAKSVINPRKQTTAPIGTYTFDSIRSITTSSAVRFNSNPPFSRITVEPRKLVRKCLYVSFSFTSGDFCRNRFLVCLRDIQ